MSRRYPLEPLFALTGWTLNQVNRLAPCNGYEYQRRRTVGVTERTADRLAVAAGFHPWSVWPELAEEASLECPECGGRFVPTRKGHRFCTPQCRLRLWKRNRYATDPAYAEKVRAQRRASYQECREYEVARQRRYDALRRAEREDTAA